MTPVHYVAAVVQLHYIELPCQPSRQTVVRCAHGCEGADASSQLLAFHLYFCSELKGR